MSPVSRRSSASSSPFGRAAACGSVRCPGHERWHPATGFYYLRRPHRASGALALHVLEAMEAFQISSDQGRRVKLETTVERPAMMSPGLATGQIN